MLTAQDERLEALSRWLEGQTAVTGLDLTTVTPASADASFRRYFRVQGEGATYIVMDAPPEKEPIDSFLKVDALMKNAGLNVPEILASDAEQGFILMSDLGLQTYLDVLNEDNAARLMDAATDALVKWQAASKPGVLPEYDYAVLRREIDLSRNGTWAVIAATRLPKSKAKSLRVSTRRSLPRVWHSPRSSCIATLCPAT